MNVVRVIGHWGAIVKGKGLIKHLERQKGRLCAVIFTLMVWIPLAGHPNEARHTITIINQSGQIAEVKLMGPKKKFIKIPLDQKKIVRVSQGTYYLLIRYGFSQKEYLYTKSDPFMVKEQEDQYSHITFTLHRIVAPHPNTQSVPPDEFENASLSPSSP